MGAEKDKVVERLRMLVDKREEEVAYTEWLMRQTHKAASEVQESEKSSAFRLWFFEREQETASSKEGRSGREIRTKFPLRSQRE